jgi:hypothetical protein
MMRFVALAGLICHDRIIPPLCAHPEACSNLGGKLVVRKTGGVEASRKRFLTFSTLAVAPSSNSRGALSIAAASSMVGHGHGGMAW